MRTITLFLFASLGATSLHAAWYQKTDETNVEPILAVFGSTQSYSGPNLQPGVVLPDAPWWPKGMDSKKMGALEKKLPKN
jgi:hypothetical protein